MLSEKLEQPKTNHKNGRCYQNFLKNIVTGDEMQKFHEEIEIEISSVFWHGFENEFLRKCLKYNDQETVCYCTIMHPYR